MQDYQPSKIEKKVQDQWAKNKLYEPSLSTSKNPYYNLMMFPYPSAEGLHVGNMYAFTGSDIYGRFKRMQGFDVLEPIGLDGFGIHSENYTLKINKHPMDLSKVTEANFYRQLHQIGNGFSWSTKVETYDTNYYKWTQWIFIQLFKAGLAYKTEAPVNWCPSCKTVLADEQVVAKRTQTGRSIPNTKYQIQNTISVCERCGTEVVKKMLSQWFFKITDYAQRLLDNLKKLDWSENVKIAQANWLGKSEGVEIVFACDIENDSYVTVFTTRADTIFGVTYMALAPEHPQVIKILNKTKGSLRQEIQKYVSYSLARSDTERLGKVQGVVKTGVFTGFYCTNPLSGKKVPIYIADYVLMSYGTGAVMGVPAHDQRDWDFAKKYHLDIVEVVRGDVSQKAFTDYGTLVNSGKYSGLSSGDAIEKITKDIEKNHLGSAKTTWHLRDWIISRQRYWGPPIPMIYCKKCASEGKSWFTTEGVNNESRIKNNGSNKRQNHNSKFTIHNSPEMAGWYPVPEADLPVELPYIKNFKPTGTGVAPLASDPKFVKVKCPGCGSEAKRETDVSDTFLDSAWYFLRYPSTRSARSGQAPWDAEITKRWLPVDMYIGGAEHAVLHLLYSRFLTMVFADLGLTDFEEPFSKFRAHGLLIKDGAKMSKSKGNIVNPDDYIAKYGADTLRCYLMFCGRYEQGGDFRDTGIEGMSRFLRRVWRLVNTARGPVSSFLPASARSKVKSKGDQKPVVELRAVGNPSTAATPRSDILHLMHKTIKKVTEDIEGLDYNTAISALMEWVNALEEKAVNSSQLSVHSEKSVNREPVTVDEIENLLLLLAPFAPFMTEELWQSIGNHESRIKNKGVKKIHNSQFVIHNSIHLAPWPKYDQKLATAAKIVLVVQVNGKVRDRIDAERGIPQEEAEKLALKSEKVKKYLPSAPSKVIFVKDRLINFVI